MKMVEYLFIRHGQTDWNVDQRVIGRQPVSLNEQGKRQAKSVASYLKDVALEVVATSPVARAKETAQTIVKSRSDVKLLVEEGLTEVNYGEWVGLTIAEITSRYENIWQDYHGHPEKMKIPGGETLVQVRDRTIKAISKLREKFPEGRIALVSHADVIKLAIIGMLKWPIKMFKFFSMDNGAMILLREHPLLGMRMVWYNPMNGVGNDIKDGQ